MGQRVIIYKYKVERDNLPNGLYGVLEIQEPRRKIFSF